MHVDECLNQCVLWILIAAKALLVLLGLWVFSNYARALTSYLNQCTALTAIAQEVVWRTGTTSSGLREVVSTLPHFSVCELGCLLQQRVPLPRSACLLSSSRRSTTNSSTPITPRDPMPIHPKVMGVMIGQGARLPTTTSDRKAPSHLPLRSQLTLLGVDPWGWTACQQASWPTCLASLRGR